MVTGSFGKDFHHADVEEVVLPVCCDRVPLRTCSANSRQVFDRSIRCVRDERHDERVAQSSFVSPGAPPGPGIFLSGSGAVGGVE